MISIVYGYYVAHGGIGRFISETLKHVRKPEKYEILTLEDTFSAPVDARVKLLTCIRDKRFLSEQENLDFSLAVKEFTSKQKNRFIHTHGVYPINPQMYTAHICLAAYFKRLEEMFGKHVAGNYLPILTIEEDMLRSLREERIFPVSKKVALELSRFYGFDYEKFTVVSGASRFNTKIQSQHSERKTRRVGVVGNNIHAKGLFKVCDIIRELRKEGMAVEGIFVGCDIATQEAIKGYAGESINLVGKYSINKEFYESLDCYMCLSAYEGYSLSTLEAMSLGIPVVSSGLNGVFFDAKIETPRLKLAEVNDIRDTVEIKEMTKRVLEDNQFREQVVKSGQEITKKHTWKAVAEAYEKVYEANCL